MSRARASGYSSRTSGATRWFRTNAKKPTGIAVFVAIAIVVVIAFIAVAIAIRCAIACIKRRVRAKRYVDTEAAVTNADADYIRQGKTNITAANSCSLNIEPPAPKDAHGPYPYLQANGRLPFPSEPERPKV